MKNFLKTASRNTALLLITASIGLWAAKKAKDGNIEVKIMRRVAADYFSDVNEFQITEEEGIRYCGNAIVPKHAVHLPWLKDLRKPAGGLKGLPEPPKNCKSLLKWDGLHFCLDRLKRKSQILDLVRRCSEF